MSEQPRDWDREMADIDRMADQQRGTPAGGIPPAPGSGPYAPARRGPVALTWFWALLAVALAVALPLWPYQRACGLKLFFYLGAVVVTLVIAIVGALASWGNRRGFAHVLSLLVVLWVGAVAAHEVLPRIGYAKASLAWMCTTEPGAPVRPAGVETMPTQAAPSTIAPSGTTPSGTAPTGAPPTGTTPPANQP
ncbi:MAG: hypothetical protein ABI860_06920 [Gemmatimonadales bacterium]